MLVREERVRTLAEIGLCVALAAVLGLLKLTLPWNIAGGSISLSMLPIFIISLRRGMGAGMITGVLFGVVDYLMEPFFVHPAQVLLDYPLGFGACGLAGLFVLRWRGASSGLARDAIRAAAGAAIGGIARFAASFASGIVFFGANAAPDQPVWLYSLLYNGSYLVPSMVACGAAAAIVTPAIQRALPVRDSRLEG